MEKIIWVKSENGEIEKIQEIEVKYNDDDYNLIHEISGRNMLDENPVGGLYKDEYYGDGWTIEYTVKLGCFSWDLTDLYENYNSMKELSDAMSKLSLVENNDAIYNAYIEENWIMSEEYAQAQRRDYEMDMRKAYYS